METFTVVHHITHTVQADTMGDAIAVSRSILAPAFIMGEKNYWDLYADDNSSSVRLYGQDG